MALINDLVPFTDNLKSKEVCDLNPLGPKEIKHLKMQYHLFYLIGPEFLIGHHLGSKSGLLILCDGAISLVWPQITSDHTIWGKSHIFVKKNAKFK